MQAINSMQRTLKAVAGPLQYLHSEPRLHSRLVPGARIFSPQKSW